MAYKQTRRRSRPASSSVARPSRNLEPAFNTTEKMAYKQTRRRPRKPKSIMVAVSTPGWKVVDREIVRDGSEYIDLSSSEDEPSTSKDKTSTSKDKTSTSKDKTSTSKDKTSTSKDEPQTSKDEPQTSKDKTSISQDESDEDYEMPLEHPDSRWRRPTPPLPAAVAFSLYGIFMNKTYNRGVFEEVVKLLRKSGCPADLINEGLVHWLFSIMQLPRWNLIDLSLSSRLCAAQLEDRIEYILRTEKSKQAEGEFDMREAAHGPQMVLACYVRRLCERERMAQLERRFFISRQKKLRWGDKEEDAKRVYDSRANDIRYKEPMSVSPEREMLPSIETDSPDQLGRRQPSRLCRTGAVKYVDLTV